MRLFHVSEEANIDVFYPRIPERNDLDKNIGLVWAIDEQRLPNFLTPRDCPRVTYHIGKNTSEADKKIFFTSLSIKHTVIIESDWFNRMKDTTLYLSFRRRCPRVCGGGFPRSEGRGRRSVRQEEARLPCVGGSGLCTLAAPGLR